MKLKSLISEESFIGHASIHGGDLYVDSNLLNKINSLKVGLSHMGMGNFETKEPLVIPGVGKIYMEFTRASKQFDDFVGRSHIVHTLDERHKEIYNTKIYDELIKIFKNHKITENKLNESKLVDKVYDALSNIEGFDKLGMDQQGQISMAVEKMLRKYGLK